jgi:hypothetical protein
MHLHLQSISKITHGNYKSFDTQNEEKEIQMKIPRNWKALSLVKSKLSLIVSFDFNFEDM